MPRLVAENNGQGDDQRFGHAGGQQEDDALPDVLVDVAARFHRLHDGGEVVVGQHHFCRFARSLGAFQAHGDTHVRPLQRWCIINAVSGHGDHVPLRLQRGDQSQLVFG